MNQYFHQHLRSCLAPVHRHRRLAIWLATLAMLCLGSTGVSAQTFPNFEMWQQAAFRGFVAPLEQNDRGWSAFESTGANLARIFVTLTREGNSNQFTAPSTLYDSMDRIVEQANRRNFKIVVTFNPLPKAPDHTYWFSTEQQDSIVAIIRAFATRYSGESAFAGFDLLNEPYPANVFPESIRDGLWLSLASRIIDAIRAQDPTRIIVYEFPRWTAQYDNLQPIPYAGVVYSSHWYQPFNLTHQGVEPEYPMGVPYPVPASYGIGIWNRDEMKQDLQPLRNFQLRYQVPIYFGEFSCARWAPGKSSYKYDVDVVSIFEEFDFSWSYHEFRGAQQWDAETTRGYISEGRSMNTDLMRFLRQTMLSKNP